MLPVPRGKPAGMSEYQAYVKENYARVRDENGGVDGKEVMRLLGRGYQEVKARGAAEVVRGAEGLGVVEVDEAVETVDVSDDEAGGLGAVARKLDFLSLKA